MNMGYNRYPKEMKEAIVAKLLEDDVRVSNDNPYAESLFRNQGDRPC